MSKKIAKIMDLERKIAVQENALIKCSTAMMATQFILALADNGLIAGTIWIYEREVCI